MYIPIPLKSSRHFSLFVPVKNKSILFGHVRTRSLSAPPPPSPCTLLLSFHSLLIWVVFERCEHNFCIPFARTPLLWKTGVLVFSYLFASFFFFPLSYLSVRPLVYNMLVKYLLLPSVCFSALLLTLLGSM
jgi:hypothetical protein